MKIFNSAPCLALLFAATISSVGLNRDKTNLNKVTATNYYQNQLITENSKKIYSALNDILKEDKFKTGDYTIDLVSEGYLENKEYVQSSLISDFVAARDCFRFDNPELFYVDFSKLSIRQIQNGNTYRINLGIGREDSYFSSGFTKENVDQRISEVNKKIDEIVTLANSKDSKVAKLDSIYKSIIASSTYALETTAKEENKLFVRTPYGALVKGEALCEGFATTTKMALDKLGYTSVLVQGMFSYEDRTELHMWNYIQMEDSRWYLLDTTMDNGLKEDGTTREYFLKHGNDLVSTEYMPEGSVSITGSTSSFELKYPTLSSVAYEENSSYFTFTTESENKYASYLGMGIKAAMDKGKYILYSYDTENMKTGWNYFAQSQAATYILMGHTPSLSDFDYPDKFDITLLSDYKVVLAVTDIKPKYTFEEIVKNKLTKPENYAFTGDIKDIYHYSSVKGDISVSKSRPYVINKNPSGVSLEENKEYTVSVQYNENLKKVYPDENIEVLGNSLLGETKVSNINRTKDKPDSLTFTFTTKESYYRNLNYYFSIKNLVGENSKEAPLEASFNVVKNPEFACPKVEGAINTVYTNKPALISDGDLSSNGWIDKDGNKLEDLPFRLALVASKPSEEKSNEMTNKIEENGEKVLSSSTFELNLQLCSAQVAFLSGNKLKVLMPFPEGYGPEDKGVTFKAYHFKKDGTPELIETVVTEHGLVMYVDAFSPFAIVATEGETTTKNVAIQINGQASVNKDLLTLEKDSSQEVTISLKDEAALDYVLLNGNAIEVKNNKISVSYNELKDYGNIIEINTVIKSIKDAEINEGFHSVEIGKPNEDTTPSIPENNNDGNLIIVISISLTIALIIISGIVCFIAYKKKKVIKK